MSRIDENQIRDRLKALSQAEPTQEATDRAMQKVRDALMTDCRVGSAHRNVIGGQCPPYLTKLAAAAVLMIGLGYLGGRLSAPAPLDAEQLRADIESSLRASLEPAIRQDLLKEMDTRWDSTFAARSVELKDEFQHQVRRDLMEFAAQTLAYAGNQTDQRLAELVQQIYAARVQDRQRVAEALQYIESNRLQDRSRFGKGLVTLAARTNELLSPQ
ncbi:MAG: hypothetical protein U9Q07_01315 [Planctomycetota bacterium]|nr:hypothetical protein [Planctomycetota bacterium]